MRWCLLSSRYGWVGVAWSRRGLGALTLPRASLRQARVALTACLPAGGLLPGGGTEGGGEPPGALVHLIAAMERYLQGSRVAIPCAVDLSRLGPFQQRVLKAARAIPHGETRSYTDLAVVIGHPRAARAVGAALRRNPLPLVIPCHRVVGKDGALTGFSLGLAWKRRLLRLEGIRIRADRVLPHQPWGAAPCR